MAERDWIAELADAHHDSYPMGNIHHGTEERPDWGTFCVECKQSWPCDVSRLLDALAEHPATPAEEVAEVAVEEREARTVVISPVEWVELLAELLAEAWDKGASCVASSPTGLDRKTWDNPYRGEAT